MRFINVINPAGPTLRAASITEHHYHTSAHTLFSNKPKSFRFI